MKTPYGELQDRLIPKFKQIAGYKYSDGSWIVLAEEVEYLRLVNPSSFSESKRWKKRLGWLPVRDYNFEYSLYVNDYDLEKALEYAEKKLFENGKPVYLPDKLQKIDEFDFSEDGDNRITYGWILSEEQKAYRARTEKL